MKRSWIFVICVVLIFLTPVGKKIVRGVVLLVRDLTLKTVVTENQQVDWMKKSLAQKVRVLEREAEGVYLELKSSFISGINDDGEQVKFFLKIDDEFSGPIDDHGSTKFKIVKVDADGVGIGYESKFHHRSFGHNLITIDKGVFHLPWKPKE
jgi:hypothetical protein